MRRFFYSLFMCTFSLNIATGQISDSHVVNYIKQESAKGVSQEDMVNELRKRGVTQQQLLNLYNSHKTTDIQQNNTDIINNNNEPLRYQETSFPYLPDDKKPSALPDDKKPSARSIYGRDLFRSQGLTFAPEFNIPTPVDYRLGPGDEVIIDIWGASETVIKSVISPEGSIRVERLGPVYLNGKTVEEANKYMQQQLSKLYAGIDDKDGASQIKLTLGQIRSIQVHMMGEVATPGLYTVSSLSSVFHAIYRAGGVSEIGSLRNIEVHRNGKLVAAIDVYDYLLKEKTMNNIRLNDGDIIIVPPYISLVHIEGKVKRSMYYEMKKNETLFDLIHYAGEFTGDAYTESITIFRKSGNKDKVLSVDKADYSKLFLSDGDCVFVRSGLNLFENRIEVRGAVFRPGYFELERVITLKGLIEAAGGVREDAFLDRVLLTREKEDLTFESLPVNLRAILSGKMEDIPLRNSDVLFIATEEILRDFGLFVIFGEVNNPGPYSYIEHTTLEDLIIRAGGLRGSASMIRVDIARRIIDPYRSSPATQIVDIFTFEIIDGLVMNGKEGFALQPHDHVYVRRSPSYIEQRNVVIAGEVLFPGTYALQKKNERLSDLINRAGGVNISAFLPGAKLFRQPSLEEIARQQTAMKVTDELKDSLNIDSVREGRSYSIGIDIEKAIANPGSMDDIVLKDGDRILVPEHDNSVKINGAVMYSNTVVYKKGAKLKYYINQGGGYNDFAKKSKAYIVHMNGMVSKVRKSDADAIRPGSEIIIPTKRQRGNQMSTAEVISVGSGIASMASVIALLINALR